MTRPPALSIGMPVFNGVAYIEESIRSVLDQSFADFELIVSDNASTEGTFELVTRLAEGDRRIRPSRNAVNLGAARNMNLVFERARAPLFKWAMADDVVEPGFLENAVQEFAIHPEMVLCYGAATLIDGAGNILSAFDQGLDLRSDDVVARFRRACDHTTLLNVLSGMMRSRVLERTRMIGGFPGSDECLMVELSLHGTFREIPHPMMRRRMHGEAASAGAGIRSRQEHLAPDTVGRYAPWYLRRSYEHALAAIRAPLPLRVRARLVAIVLRSMISIRELIGREIRDGLSWLAARANRAVRP